jgi:hypothetical protein
MAYNFRGEGFNDNVEFAIAPMLGTIDAITVAAFFRRSTASDGDIIVGFSSAALGNPQRNMRVGATNAAAWIDGANFPNSSQVLGSTSIWYLLVFTKPAGAGATCRFHVHDGTSWVHANGSVTVNSFTNVSGERFRVGLHSTSTQPFTGDMVCVGIKKSDSSDATVQTLSRTAWTAWKSFGFDWLIGFDSSQESAGILQDQASPGTGDEIAISGTSAVSDPAGWSWALSATYNGSATVSLTDTVTTSGKLTARGASSVTETATITTAGTGHATAPGVSTVTETVTITTAGVVHALVHGVAVVTEIVSVTTVPRAILHTSATTVETVTITTVASRNTLVMPPGSAEDLVLVPADPDSFVITPAAPDDFTLTPLY